VPTVDNPEKAESAGAFIRCWVDMIDLNFALTEAKISLSENGWEVIETIDQCITHRDQYSEVNEEESMEYYDLAKRDGVSAIVYTYDYHD
jgi:hypothetical protein